MKIRIPDDVVFRDLSGETVLLDVGAGTYFGLNEVGSRAFALMVEHGTLEPAIAALLAEYDVPADVLRRDIGLLLERLQAKGLVVVDA
jgi:hypothetical protein